MDEHDTGQWIVYAMRLEGLTSELVVGPFSSHLAADEWVCDHREKSWVSVSIMEMKRPDNLTQS